MLDCHLFSSKTLTLVIGFEIWFLEPASAAQHTEGQRLVGIHLENRFSLSLSLSLCGTGV
jgi:hypothetical protein